MVKLLTFCLLLGSAHLASLAQEKNKYNDVPDQQKTSEQTPSSNQGRKELATDSQQPTITKESNNMKNAGIALRIVMGVTGVICYEFKECREALNVLPSVNSTPSRSRENQYTYVPKFDFNTSKYSFVALNSQNTNGSVPINTLPPSFYYQLPTGWSASRSEKAGKVTIKPFSQGGQRELKTAIILGVLPIGSNLYDEAQNYVKQMMQSNPHLSANGEFENGVVGKKQCYYKQFSGFSKDIDANETVIFFGCKKNQNTMFYSVLVYNDKTTTDDKKGFWQIWSSVDIGN